MLKNVVDLLKVCGFPQFVGLRPVILSLFVYVGVACVFTVSYLLCDGAFYGDSGLWIKC